MAKGIYCHQATWQKNFNIHNTRPMDLIKLFHRVKYSGYKRAERMIERAKLEGWTSPVKHPQLVACREVFFMAYPGQVWLWVEFTRFLYHKQSLLIPSHHW